MHACRSTLEDPTEAVASLRGGAVGLFTVGAIAVTYVAFGLWAMFTSDLNPHFVLFIATGLLIGCLLIPRRS